MGHATATEPALIRVKLDRRPPFFRVGCQFIAHADVNTGVAARANILVEVDRFEGHPIPPFNVFQRSSCQLQKILSRKKGGIDLFHWFYWFH
jgi:hypothetical protein